MLGGWKPAARWCVVAASASFLSFGASSAAAKKPDLHLKVATVAPEGSAWMKVMRQIDREVRDATDNAVGFKVYPGGVQGDEAVVLRKVRSGQLHGGGLSGLGLGLIAPETRVMEVPGR
jgi:TRAP-type C4-dicarboxylate transport system substrate-binding protein